jgi:hypothetical protein
MNEEDYDNETAEELRDVLLRNGFVRCDIPACNCGSWHARYGLPERYTEIKDILADAGHPLCNTNGHLAREALKQLIDDRNAKTTLARELLVALKNSYHGHACDPSIFDASDKCHCCMDAVIAKAEAMLR